MFLPNTGSGSWPDSIRGAHGNGCYGAQSDPETTLVWGFAPVTLAQGSTALSGLQGPWPCMPSQSSKESQAGAGGWGSMRRPLGHLKRQHGLAPLWPPPGPSAHWSWSSHSKVTIPGDRDTAGSGRELEGGQKQARCEKSLETLWAMWPTGLEPPSWSRTSKMENEPKNLFA